RSSGRHGKTRERLALGLPSGYGVGTRHRSSTSMADDAISRHFFNGFIRLHILYHAAKEPIFGAEITEELIHHGYRLSQGTLYPALHLLEEQGYLSSRSQIVGGKRRKYYQATAAGRRVLRQAR